MTKAPADRQPAAASRLSGRRREVIVALGALAMAPGARSWAYTKPSVAALFAGSVQDGGFMQAGYDGLIAARDRLGVAVVFRQQVEPGPDRLAAALRDLAAASPTLVIAHGGQNDGPARTVAAEFPAVHFVVTQGAVAGANLASYGVLQEQSAFLAGALAGLVTRTGVVGHLSGIRVAPGLKSRAAYAAGLRRANPAARLLTSFCGDQDNAALAHRVALAMIDQKADVLFTMLNAGRTGAIDACRERGVAQIGNVGDWTTRLPQVFVGSAVADAGAAVLAAIEDLVAGRFVAGVSRSIGLERPDAVRLTLRGDVPTEIRATIAGLTTDIAAGRLAVPTDWTGEEFTMPD